MRNLKNKSSPIKPSESFSERLENSSHPLDHKPTMPASEIDLEVEGKIRAKIAEIKLSLLDLICWIVEEFKKVVAIVITVVFAAVVAVALGWVAFEHDLQKAGLAISVFLAITFFVRVVSIDTGIPINELLKKLWEKLSKK